MRAMWAGVGVLLVFGSVHAMGLWGDKSPQTSQTNITPQPKIANTTTFRADLTSTSSGSPQTAPAAPSSSAIAALIVQQSRAAYYATGHPCACPDDLMRNGRRCGGSSAYSRPGGAAPKCYVSDVSAADIEKFRAQR